MPNPDVAQMIANALQRGLPHPGNPANDEKPYLIPLVAFRTAGMPEELREHADTSALAVGQAIVNLIETDAASVILKRAALDELRAADNDDLHGDSLPVVCRSCRNPMLYLRVVNGRALVSGNLLAGVNPTCPHRVEPAQ